MDRNIVFEYLQSVSTSTALPVVKNDEIVYDNTYK